MKKILIVCIYLAFCAILTSQKWAPIGSPSSDNTTMSSVCLDIDGNDVPYIAYENAPYHYVFGIVVKRYNGLFWEVVGDGSISQYGEVSYLHLAINSNNVPYIAFTDGAHSNKSTVMRFNGASWEVVGVAGFSDGQAWAPFIDFDNFDVPYIAFTDGAHSNKSTVMRFNGASWEVVGVAGFSDYIALCNNLVFDSSNALFLGHVEIRTIGVYYGQAIVSRYDNILGEWVSVGMQFSDYNADFSSIAVDDNDVIYVAYNDGFDHELTVKSYDGISWKNVGDANFSEGSASFPRIAINGNGVLCVAYKDWAYDGAATVMKYSGVSWEVVGVEGFSNVSINYPKIVFNSSGVPYVAYKRSKATVMKFSNSINNLRDNAAPPEIITSNYPNPFRGETKISFSTSSSEMVKLEIYNIKGQLIKTLVDEVRSTGNHSVLWDGNDRNGRAVSDGIYFYKMSSGRFSSSKKMILMK